MTFSPAHFPSLNVLYMERMRNKYICQPFFPLNRKSNGRFQWKRVNSTRTVLLVLKNQINIYSFNENKKKCASQY